MTARKNVTYYLGLPYTLQVNLDEDGGWFSHVRELPGCMSQGDTAEEAFRNLQEVLPLWLESALESGYDIPEPRPAEDYSGKFVVRVPRSLHRELVERAEANGVSLNQFVNVVLAKAVGQGPQLAGYEQRPPARVRGLLVAERRRPGEAGGQTQTTK